MLLESWQAVPRTLCLGTVAIAPNARRHAKFLIGKNAFCVRALVRNASAPPALSDVGRTMTIAGENALSSTTNVTGRVNTNRPNVPNGVYRELNGRTNEALRLKATP